jgi:aspartyl/asparaginyl beta-hydroxylase (cupin superfamily)
MQSSKPVIWYGSSMRPYAENEPWYYEAKSIQALSDIEHNWTELKEEITTFIKEKDSAFISNKAEYSHIDLNDGWSIVKFLFWGKKVSGEFKNKCPKTMGYLNKVPGLVSLSISKLAPKSVLAEHSGDTNAIMRCHLGVEIPAGLPEVGLKVNGEERGWVEGKWVIFNDAYRHSAWNNTDKRRIVIIIDIIRPEFIRQKNWVCAFILTRHVSYAYNKVKLIAKLPVFVKTALFAFFLGFIYL